MSQPAKQSRVSRATSRVTVKFSLQGGDGAEEQDVRVENRQPANVVEGTLLAGKRLDYQDRDSAIVGNGCSTFDRRFIDVRLVEMAAD